MTVKTLAAAALLAALAAPALAQSTMTVETMTMETTTVDTMAPAPVVAGPDPVATPGLPLTSGTETVPVVSSARVSDDASDNATAANTDSLFSETVAVPVLTPEQLQAILSGAPLE